MSLPTTAQIALALVITKSKPIDVTFSDYFQQIRQIIVEKSHKEPIRDQRYIDGVSFWKQAYENSEAEKTALENKVFMLEQQIRMAAIHATDIQGSSVSQKRKTEKVDPRQSTKANTQTKRRKVDTETLADLSARATVLDAESAPTNCQILLRCLHSLCRISSENEGSRRSARQKIRLCCHAAATVVKTACHSSTDLTSYPESASDVDKIFEVINHVWKMVLIQINRTSVESEADDHPSYVPDIVYLFQTLLGQLHQLALDEADRRLKANKHHDGKRGSANTSGRANDREMFDYATTCRSIMITLQTMFAGVAGDSGIDWRIFEGLMCALLDHIGSCLSLLVFSDPKSDKPPSLGLLAPRGLVDVSHLETDTARLTSSIAAPYLIPVLRQAMAVAKRFPGNSSLETSHLMQKNDSEARSLTTCIATRLQETLLRGVYGDDDRVFGCALARSAEIIPVGGDEYDALTGRGEDNPHWLVSQVWENLGWDVLVEKLSIISDESI